MSDLQIVNARISGGVWRGVIVGGTEMPQIEVRHLDAPIEDIDLAESDVGWMLSVPIPADSISDGVQTFAIFDSAAGHAIGDFTLIAGEAMGDDIRSEMELLRAELDMLKRAFRRHCSETA